MSAPPGELAPTQLVEARLQLHHAAQLVSAVGATWLPKTADDSHPNLAWDDGVGGLVGRGVEARRPFRAALAFAALELQLQEADGTGLASLPLAGRSLEDGLVGLAAAVEKHGGEARPLTLPGYELPEHPLGTGAPFAPPGAGHAELGRWFALAQTGLEAVAQQEPRASEIRCWPHHFDLATLIAVETGPGGAATKTIGVGLSPGDESYPEPYWYVTPWPYPEGAALPDLAAGGTWHTEGFTAAILTGSRLLAGGDDAAETTRRFVASALAACQQLHGR